MSEFEKWLETFKAVKYDDNEWDRFLYDPTFPGVGKVYGEQMDSRRWEKTLRSIYHFPAENRYMALEWNQGLTEYQDADPNLTAYEVYPNKVTTIIYTTEQQIDW